MSKRVQKVFNLPSRTKQGFRDECDINIIMKRFKNTMGVDYLNRYQGYLSGEFGAFSTLSNRSIKLGVFLRLCRPKLEAGSEMIRLSSWILFRIQRT